MERQSALEGIFRSRDELEFGCHGFGRLPGLWYGSPQLEIFVRIVSVGPKNLSELKVGRRAKTER